MKVQTFLCIGGPLDGLTVTEQYAGDDYFRFISASGQIKNRERIEYRPGKFVWKSTNIRVPKNVLLYWPQGYITNL